MAVEAPPTEARPAGRPRPRREREEEVLVWPDLVFVEFIAAVLFTLTFVLLSVFVNAPLLNRANFEVTPNPSKAPWYFLNLQELLLHMHPAWGGVILPTIFLGFLAIIPFIDRSTEQQGVWFGTRFAARIAGVTALYAMAVTWMLVIFDGGKFEKLFRWIPSCDLNLASGEPAAHQFPPCLVDTASGHVGLLSARDFQTRFRFSIGDLDWPLDFSHIPWPFNSINQGGWSVTDPKAWWDRITDPKSWGDWNLSDIGLGGIHGWGGEHLNLAAAFAEQILPLSLIAFLTVLIIYILFRVGWVRTTHDIMIVMFTGALAAYLTLTIIPSFFRGPGQDLILPTDIKVDEG